MNEPTVANMTFFTEEELRIIFNEAGAEKISKTAIKALQDELADIGYSIIKIATSTFFTALIITFPSEFRMLGFRELK